MQAEGAAKILIDGRLTSGAGNASYRYGPVKEI
jgi:hypothetical protein